MLDDRVGMIVAGGELALVLGEQALRFLAQALGLVELGPDLARMTVERAGDRPAERLPDHRDQDHQRDQQPDL